MSIEENKAIVRRWNDEIINKGNVDIVDELAAANYVNHADGSDREGFKRYWKAVGAAFSNGNIAIEDLFAEGDKVVIRWMIRATHTGEYLGVPATGKKMEMAGISIYRIANGKIVQDWSVSDQLGMMQQLGLVPSMG
ncbi:MAG: ester cyclase [Anaerolineae bacterium]|nr:ester cyclase [Anaerolineae bacterium]